MQRAIQIFYLLHFTASFKSLNFQLRAAGISWKTQHWHIIAFKVNMVNFLACLDSEQHYRSYPDTRRVQPQFIFILLVRIWSCGSLGLLLADMWPWYDLFVALGSFSMLVQISFQPVRLSDWLSCPIKNCNIVTFLTWTTKRCCCKAAWLDSPSLWLLFSKLQEAIGLWPHTCYKAVLWLVPWINHNLVVFLAAFFHLRHTCPQTLPSYIECVQQQWQRAEGWDINCGVDQKKTQP